jgi:hypothetical protein
MLDVHAKKVVQLSKVLHGEFLLKSGDGPCGKT